MTIERVKKVIKAAAEGNELPFSRFLQDTYQILYSKLMALTKSKPDTDDIFIAAMQKFWERFVISQENLPHNIEGYIFVMCKNAWLLQKRSAWHTKMDLKNTLFKKDNAEEPDSLSRYERLENDERKAAALTKAIEAMSPKCKSLIEAELDPSVKLKDLQSQLGYKNYQALVQAKYNCKKRLIKKVYDILVKLKANPEQ